MPRLPGAEEERVRCVLATGSRRILHFIEENSGVFRVRNQCIRPVTTTDFVINKLRLHVMCAPSHPGPRKSQHGVVYSGCRGHRD